MRIVGFSLRLLPALLLWSAMTNGVAQADPIKCRAAIGKSAGAFAAAKLKLLQKCREGQAKKGLDATSCPDPDGKVAAKLASLVAKANSGIVKACAGKDKVCGTGGDDDTPAAIGFPATCPGFEGSASSECTGSIGDCGEISHCVNDCIGEHAVDQAIDLAYGSLNPADPKLQKTLNKCQLALGKSAAAFFLAKSKAIQKCWDNVNKGKASGPCPPFGADQKTDDAINKAKTKYDDTTCKACGAGKPCDITQSPFTRADIGFASLCPPVVKPGSNTCDFGRTLVSTEDVRDCLECVTEFKVDCLTAAAASGITNAPPYPSECNVALPATPTRTATPVLTATATPTATLTPTSTAPTVTSTPGPGTPTKTATPTVTKTATPTVTSTPVATATPSCPTKIEFTGTSTDGVLDTGWTGNGHDATVISNGKVTVGVSGCTNPSPPCGVCTYSGPIANTSGLQNQRCVGGANGTKLCTVASECPGGTCKFFFGSYLPLAAGGVSTCVENTFAGGISGTANMATGDSTGLASVTSRVYNGITLSNPCPQCNGGHCSGGPNNGLACTVNGSSPNAAFGSTSLDCPPAGGALIATLPINLNNTTATFTRTLSAANPSCTNGGWTTNRCQCDTCDDAASTPCATNADCPIPGGICGGLRCTGGSNVGAPCPTAGASSVCPGAACGRKGTATAANQCDGGSGDCAADPGTPSPNDRKCVTGPNENFCTPVETFRGCGADSDCPFAGDTCTLSRFRDCFDNGTLGETVKATGQPDPPVAHMSDPKLAAMFCIGPTTSASVNNAAGLPGLGRLELTGHAVDNGTP